MILLFNFMKAHLTVNQLFGLHMLFCRFVFRIRSLSSLFVSCVVIIDCQAKEVFIYET